MKKDDLLTIFKLALVAAPFIAGGAFLISPSVSESTLKPGPAVSVSIHMRIPLNAASLPI
jgi:hypothetical protein